jgi:two-component system CheB/CheR fusion protein
MQNKLDKTEIDKVFDIVKDRFDADFSNYKLNCLSRRIKRRMLIARFDDIEDYIIFLKSSSQEQEYLYDAITINVTRFFRDEETYKYVNENILPDLAANSKINIWSAGCASGEEPYSLAMMFEYYKIVHRLPFQYTVYANDIDENSITIAEKGIYTPKSLFNVSPEFKKIFDIFSKKEKNYYHISQNIKNKVEFRIQNLLSVNWKIKFDLILCRNVFIYFERKLQDNILSTFKGYIQDDGYLVLGRVETIFQNGKNLFDIVSNRNKVYKIKKE